MKWSKLKETLCISIVVFICVGLLPFFVFDILRIHWLVGSMIGTIIGTIYYSI